MRPHPGADLSTPNPLRLLFWESTSRCNLACIHCRRQDVSPAAAAQDLTTDEARSTLASAATLGRPIIVFSGGEPLLRPDWQPLAQHARGLGLTTALATNATLIDAAIAGQIAAAGFHRVSVSMDGADRATHDAFRGVPGAMDAAIRGIGHLKAAGVPFQINATIAAHNVNQLDALHDLACSLGAVGLHLFLLVPVGCGAQIGESHQLAPRQYERVLQWICKRQLHSRQAAGPQAASPHVAGQVEGMELKATCAPHYYRVAAQHGLATGRGRGCLCGRSVVFVSHTGEVFPCGYLPVRCGSVRQQALAEIWRDSPVIADLRDDDRLRGRCGRCGYRALCGGCRARAYAMTGDYLAEEPACALPERGD